MKMKALFLCTAVGMVGAACGSDNGDGGGVVTPKGTLQIRTMMDYTGPTSDNAAVYYQGIKDSMDDANASGGIKGWMLAEEFVDHAYDLVVAQKQYDAFKAEASWSSVVGFFSWGTPDSQMFSADALKEKKIFISGSYANTLATPIAQDHQVVLPTGTTVDFKADPAPYNFFAGTDYGTLSRVGMEFVKKSGGRKIAFAYCRESPFCAEPIPAARTWAKQIGLSEGPDTLDITLSDSYDVIDGKMKAYITAHPDVDWYWVGNAITTSLNVAKAVKKYTTGVAGVTPAKIISNMWGMDERAFDLCGADCVGNTYVVMPFAAYGDLQQSTAMADVVALFNKRRAIDHLEAKKYANVRYVQGYVSFFIFRRAVEQLVTQGKTINGENLKNALETFRNVDSGGLTAPISYTTVDHRPTNRVRIYSMNAQGKFQYEDQLSLTLETNQMGW
jgi:branched-chain amino acid transport system substrate-binding protein